ncbi:MAG: DegT/DnrJ/EryC1/StrS family aminotransferase [Clostridia bacterium]|nr:DegT/DnrJ/EryC1/StrS family aminotransferase [Clostridia bacterium]
MGGDEMNYVNEAFAQNWIAPIGPNVDGFEKELSEYVGSREAVALSSATAAIHLALKYLGVGQGDYVFCSTLTFAGTCNPILYEKAIPVFIDSEPETWNMSPYALEEAFKAYSIRKAMPKAVIIVDLYGQSADYDKLLGICRNYGVPVIEDAAEALGAEYKGKHCGTFGSIGVFSFNGNKIITTSGGGVAVSDDPEAIKKIRFWSTQSREPKIYYEHKEIGYNYRMSNVIAGIGRGQLKVLGQHIERKKEIFTTYKNAFKELKTIRMMPIAEYGEPNYWLSVVLLDKSNETTVDLIIKKLEENNIESRPLWKPMHLQPVFEKSDYFQHDSDIAADLFRRGVCLPSGSTMTGEEQQTVIETVKSVLAP